MKASICILQFGVLVLLAASGAQLEGQAVAVERNGGSIAYTVHATVPPVIRLVVDPSREGGEGGPVVQVVTNIPQLRRDPGMAAEVLRAEEFLYSVHPGGRGGQASIHGKVRVEGPIVRYTIVSP